MRGLLLRKLLWVVAALWFGYTAHAQENIIDGFGSAAYNLNSGTRNWAGNWTETGETTSPTAGLILVTGGALRVGSSSAATAAGLSIQRSANLTNFGSATLSFSVSQTGVDATGDSLVVEASSNGTSFTTLATFTNTGAATPSYDLTPYLSATTTIRFRVTNALESGEFFTVDNVQISLPDVEISQTGTTSTNTNNMISYRLKIWNRGVTAAGATVNFTAPVSLVNVNWYCRGFGPSDAGNNYIGALCGSGAGEQNRTGTGNLPSNFALGNLPTNNVATPPTSDSYIEITILGTVVSAGSLTSSAATVTNGSITNTSGTVSTTTVTVTPNFCTDAGGTRGPNRFDDNGSFGSLTGTPLVMPPTLGGALPAGRTSYSYEIDSPEDGEYNITNSIRYRTDFAWHYPNAHTTGQITDLMMSVNASYQPGVFYEQTITVTPNTVHDFSVWVANLMSFTAIRPNLEFEIDRIGIDDDANPATSDGNEGQTIAVTGDIPEGDLNAQAFVAWRNYGSFVNSGGASQITVRLRNNAPGGGGNDLVLDDFFFAACSVAVGYVTGFVYPDNNSNNSRDAGEGGLDGITVYLYNGATLVTATKTSFDGSYTFTVQPGSYTVRVLNTDPDLPLGATLGTPNDLAVTVTNGNTASGNNFGFDLAAISGTVFEDVTYGGGAGRSYAAALNAVPRPNVRLEVYNSSGGYVTSLFTDAQGRYSYVPGSAGTFYIRVVNNFVTSSRGGACALATNVTTAPASCTQLPVQTYRTNAGTAVTNEVGGRNPALVDAGLVNATGTTLNTTSGALTGTVTGQAQSFAQVTLATASSKAANVDFGFNFDTIVSSRDAGQGSLRQFILNSNALVNAGLDQTEAGNTVASAVTKAPGEEVSIFMIPTTDPNYSSGVVTIRPVTKLDTITAASTTINGKTQTAYTGDLRASVAPSFDAAGALTNAASVTRGPEIVIQGPTTNIGPGFDTGLNARFVKFEGVGVQSFVAGAAAGHGLLLLGDNPTVRDSDMLQNQGSGIQVSTNTTTLVANGQLLNNVFRGNGVVTNSGADGISLEGSTGFTIDNNYVQGSGAFGIDLTPRESNNNTTLTNNIVTANGSSAGTLLQNGGISLRRASNTLVSTNRIFSNTGDGIIVQGGTGTATGNRLTQNSIYNNGELGIDLNAGTANNGDGVSLNNATNSSSTVGGNNMLNFPVLESVQIEGSNLVIQGFSKPNTTLEFFIADADPSNFGEGRTYLSAFVEGSVQDTNATTGTYGPAAVNSVLQGTDTTNRFSFTFPLPSGVTTGTFITATATCLSANSCTAATNNSTSEFSGRVQATSLQLTGRIFEDFNYGGGVGRAYNAAQGMSLRPGVRVELYSSAGNYLGAALTNASGVYTFSVLPSTTYTVRAVNQFITSSRTGGCTPSTDVATPPASCTQIPVQTFRTSGLTSNVGTADAVRVGGEDLTKVDAALNTSGTLALLTTTTTTAQSITSVTMATANVSNIDFGFNFDTIVSTRDAGQGSLRQFILNSNALGGEASLVQFGSRLNTGTTQALPSGKETSIFMISNGVANPGLRAGLTNQLTSGVAVITPVTVLEALSGTNAPYTVIDGTTQSFNVRVTSGGAETNAGVLGSGGTVGVDALALGQVQRPEVQIVGATSNLVGLDLQASNLTVRGISIYGFGNGPNVDTSANIRIGNTYTTTLIEQNIIGTPATSFDGSSAASGTNPCGGSRSNADNIRSVGGDNGTVQNNLVGWATGKGFGVESGSQNWLIENNEIRCNAITNAYLDAIDLESTNTTGNTVQRNLLWQNEGVGADMYQSAGSNAVVNNTIRQNGIGTPNETPGVRLYGSNNIVLKNIIESNYGAGVMATCQVSCVATTTISRNAIYDNGEVVGKTGNAASGQIGIDLTSATESETLGTSPFVTKNESGDADVGANDLYNFPVFESAEVSSTTLILKGFSRPGAVIEIFIANDDPSGFGEGQTYRVSLREGGTGAGTLVNGVNVDPVADADGATGTYNDISATGPGTDTTNRFQFTIALPSGIGVGTTLTATATLLSGSSVTIGGTSYQTGTTSEFSKVVTVTSNVKLGLAKALDRIIHSNNATDNVYTLVYRLTVENFSSGALSNLILYDDVVAQFSGLAPTNFNTWVNVPANAALLSPAGTLTRSSTWNGAASSNILTTGQSLAANVTGIIYISFDVTVNPAAASPNNQLRDNSATTQATTPSSTTVSDTSTNGTDPDGTDNDNNPDENIITPTPFVKLVKEVRNCGSSLSACSGSYGLTATGRPGDYLEYRIRYFNISSQAITLLRVADTLASATPFQEDTYAVISPNVADFNVTCPNTSTVELDRSNAALTTTPASGAITAFNINIMAATACNLTTVTVGQQGQVLFKVGIP